MMFAVWIVAAVVGAVSLVGVRGMDHGAYTEYVSCSVFPLSKLSLCSHAVFPLCSLWRTAELELASRLLCLAERCCELLYSTCSAGSPGLRHAPRCYQLSNTHLHAKLHGSFA